MANIKSAIKRARTSEQRRLRNKQVKSRMRSAIRRFVDAVESDAGDLEARLNEAVSMIDRAVTKGIVHKNQAARKKSQLYRAFNERKTG